MHKMAIDEKVQRRHVKVFFPWHEDIRKFFRGKEVVITIDYYPSISYYYYIGYPNVQLRRNEMLWALSRGEMYVPSKYSVYNNELQ